MVGIQQFEVCCMRPYRISKSHDRQSPSETAVKGGVMSNRADACAEWPDIVYEADTPRIRGKTLHVELLEVAVQQPSSMPVAGSP